MIELFELLKVVWENYKIKVEVNSWVLLIILVISVTITLIVKKFKRIGLLALNPIEIETNIGGHKCKFKVVRNAENFYIANRIYIELVTRKTVIEVDPDCDVINEVYDSWYKLFSIIRDEIKGVPGIYLENKDNSSKELIHLTIKILNEGLRPHLTKYQADFRKWFTKAQAENPDMSPQVVQQGYYKYDELMQDLRIIYITLLSYAEELYKFVYG